MFWTNLTNFGDAAAMLPAAGAIGVWLAAGRAWKAAGLWLLAMALASVLVAATKIAYLGWGIGIPALDFTGVSGHSMLATAVIGVGAYLSFQDMPRAARLIAFLLGLTAGLAVAVSRVELAFHSPSEVIAGSTLGIFVGLSFLWGSQSLRRSSWWPTALGLSLVVMLLAIHGQRAPTQQWITKIALYISGHAQPYQRTVWAEPIRDRI